jgi:hypothetical protein
MSGTVQSSPKTLLDVTLFGTSQSIFRDYLRQVDLFGPPAVVQWPAGADRSQLPQL